MAMMPVSKRVAIAAAALFAVLGGFTFFAGEIAGQTPTVTIQQARRTLETYSAGKKLGDIDLTAVNYFREVELGKGIRAIVISTNYGGGIALFSPEGVMESTLATGKVESIRLFDLNGDDISEILTDESEGPATGILIMHYDLYAVNDGKISRVWQNLSYKREAPGQRADKVREIQNFVSFNQAGAGYSARMTYLVSTAVPGQYRKIEYTMTGPVVSEVPQSRHKK
jgi:hypothetical protein